VKSNHGAEPNVVTKESEDDAAVPPVDPAMDEARHILGDLVGLTGKRNGLAVKP
jgi:hypothetical protein